MLSQEKARKNLWREMRTSLKTSNGKVLQVSSPKVQGSFPEMKPGGTEGGILHGQEANVCFNLGELDRRSYVFN